MDLKRRLRGKPDTRTLLDRNMLRKVIAAKHSRSRRSENRMDAGCFGEAVAGTQRRFGVGVSEDGAAVAAGERQLESGAGSDGLC
jgi:hypothetical protein